MKLSNRDKAKLLRLIYRNASQSEFVLFQFRVVCFTVFAGTKISVDRVANFYAPPGRPLGSGAWPLMESMIEVIERDNDDDMEATELFLLASDY